MRCESAEKAKYDKMTLDETDAHRRYWATLKFQHLERKKESTRNMVED